MMKRLLVMAAAVLVACGLAVSPAEAAATRTVKIVVTSLNGKAIYLEHHVAYCRTKNSCVPSAKDGTKKTAKYTQTVKVKRGHRLWITTTALNRHRIRVYENGRRIYDGRAVWQPQDDSGFWVSDLTYRTG